MTLDQPLTMWPLGSLPRTQYSCTSSEYDSYNHLESGHCCSGLIDSSVARTRARLAGCMRRRSCLEQPSLGGVQYEHLV